MTSKLLGQKPPSLYDDLEENGSRKQAQKTPVQKIDDEGRSNGVAANDVPQPDCKLEAVEEGDQEDASTPVPPSVGEGSIKIESGSEKMSVVNETSEKVVNNKTQDELVSTMDTSIKVEIGSEEPSDVAESKTSELPASVNKDSIKVDADSETAPVMSEKLEKGVGNEIPEKKSVAPQVEKPKPTKPEETPTRRSTRLRKNT